MTVLTLLNNAELWSKVNFAREALPLRESGVKRVGMDRSGNVKELPQTGHFKYVLLLHEKELCVAEKSEDQSRVLTTPLASLKAFLPKD